MISFLLQQFEPGSENQSQANEWFLGWWMWAAVLLPTALALILAAKNKKRKPELPQLTDMTWELDVLEATRPVLVHAHHKWSIGDRVIEAQVAQLAAAEGDRMSVFWLDIEANPGIVGAHPTLGEKCVALFVEGRLVWQAQGVHDAQSILREIEPFLRDRAGSQA